MANHDHHPTRFKQGQSGNYKGRPRGSRNKATIIREELEGGTLEFIRDQLSLARKGDKAAARALWSKVPPLPRDTTVVVDLPKIKDPTDLTEAAYRILEQVADGDLR